LFFDYIGGGFDLINQCLQRDGITGKEIAALLNVCANCASVLNDVTLEPLLSSCINAAFDHLKRLGEEELKTKEATSFSELIGALKVRTMYILLNYVSEKAKKFETKSPILLNACITTTTTNVKKCGRFFRIMLPFKETSTLNCSLQYLELL
jgi:hypothetical protein